MNLSDWLLRLEQLHPSEIDLGLQRIKNVAQRLNLPDHIAGKVITVAGTNGKGSTIHILSQILAAAGYRVGCYSSPHIQSYNERISIAGKLVSDDDLCLAFKAIDSARGDISLTYFEFGTLAALLIFSQAKLDVAILEVGLGGRLDAVNILDPDVAVVTTVALDHQAWLGSTREQIGYEKAGIFRAGIPAVIGHADVPVSILNFAHSLGVKLLRLNSEFGYAVSERPGKEPSLGCWGQLDPGCSETSRDEITTYSYSGLPVPLLPVMNAATAIQVAHVSGLVVTEAAIKQGLMTKLTGRYQRINNSYTMILDVAHNPEAAGYLASKLSKENVTGQIHALFGVLDDKESDKIIDLLKPEINSWSVVELNTARSQSAQLLQQQIAAITQLQARQFDSVGHGLSVLDNELADNDLLVIFGSFYTVAAALDWLDYHHQE